MSSYIAYIQAQNGRGYEHFLLGGVKYHESSRMETAEMAHNLLDVWVETNTKAGRKVGIHGVKTSRKQPEIMK